jgi:leucyl aminopeptidase
VEFSLINTQIQKFDGDMVVVFANSESTFNDANIQSLIELNHFESKAGEVLLLSLVQGFKARQVLVVGLGEKPNTAKNYIKALTSAGRILTSSKAKSSMIEQANIEGHDENWRHRISARVLKDAEYQIQQVGAQEQVATLENIAIQSSYNDASELLQGSSIASGMSLTRHLGDLPSNICTPTYLAQTAQDMARTFNLECDVLEEADMSALGMGSLLSVSKVQSSLRN